MPDVPIALTIGEIARRLGVPLHRVAYVIRTRRIRPSAIAGNAHIYAEADLTYVAAELRRLAAEKGGAR